MPLLPLAYTTRAERIDCWHYGSVVVTRPGGEIEFCAGDPQSEVPLRSIVKPFRVACAVEAGIANIYGLPGSFLALMAGSHSGSELHICELQKLLAVTGIPPSDLRCGTVLPLGQDAVLECITKGSRLTPLHCNCSGEHIALLAMCRLKEWDTSNYTLPGHPANEVCNALLAQFFGPLGIALVDGCNLPTYAVPLAAVSRGMATFYAERKSRHYVAQVVESMSANPFLAGGRDRFVSTFLRASGGTAIAKDGAEGLFAVGFRSGWGLAVKVADGGTRAVPPVVVDVVRRFHLLDKKGIAELAAEGLSSITTNTGQKVGAVVSALFSGVAVR